MNEMNDLTLHLWCERVTEESRGYHGNFDTWLRNCGHCVLPTEPEEIVSMELIMQYGGNQTDEINVCVGVRMKKRVVRERERERS